MEWKKPKDYGLESKRELEDSGFSDLKEMLELDDEQQIMSVCSDDLDIDDLVKLLGKIESESKEISKKGSDTKYMFKGIFICISYYEGGFTSISFKENDLEKINKQLLNS